MGHVQSKTIEFFIPSREEARHLLEQAEEIDKYQERCKYVAPLNVVARAGMRYVPVPTEEATPAPPEIPRWLSHGLPDRIPIIILDATADGGMPHTRCTAICCPGGPKAPSTMIHELIHVHQKANASKWASVYADAFQMKPWLGQIPDELAYRRRINPDTVQSPFWIWRDRWVPVPIFLRPDAPNLRDMRVYFYDATTTEWQSMPPAGWAQFFGSLADSYQEHPHELAAYWIADNKDLSSPAYRRFKNAVDIWFGTNK
jgi:hypothetical protein